MSEQMETKSEAGSDAPKITSSYQRVNLVTEAQAVLPSLTSAFSLEGVDLQPSTPQVRKRRLDLPQTAAQVSTSCQDALDVFDDPNYTDTVQSTDSASSLLRRSLSVPPQYTYRPTARKFAQEVFEDFIVKGAEDAKEAEEDHEKGSKQPWRQTMADLLENPAYVDSLQSTSSGTALLAKHAVSIARHGRPVSTHLTTWDERAEEEERIREESLQQEREHYRYVKNLLVLSISFMCIFISYMSLRNLQSSIIHNAGLALYSLSFLYACFFIGCIFATTIVQRLRPKLTICLAVCILFLYNAANFYPSYYTLIPVSGLVGFSIGNLWTAHATYLTNIAASYAQVTGKDLQNVLSKFNGIFFMFFQVSQILGGVISSTVFMSQPTHHDKLLGNVTFANATVTPDVPDSKDVPIGHGRCGADYCHDDAVDLYSVDIEKNTLYVLLSVYGVFTIIGIVMLVVFLDKLEGVMKKSHASLADQMSAVFRWLADWKVICLTGLMFYSMVQMSFMFGEFTKAYVTCPLGVHMVGYSMLCLSACGSVSSYVNGKLMKYVGRIPIFVAAGVIHMALMITMLLWKPSQVTVPVLFVISGGWGVADGIWFTQVISLFAMLFQENREAAFAGLKMCQSLSACVMFVTAKYICTAIKIYLLMGLLVFAMVGYLAVECKLKLDAKEDKKKPQKPTPV